MCRVQQHPPSMEYTFKGNPEMYNTELVGILHQLGLTEMNHAGKPQPAPQLISGRWQYPADRHETFIPTIPILFVVLQSCTNVQYIDHHFQVSYVCKYAAGVQEHREVTVSRQKAGDTVSVQGLWLPRRGALGGKPKCSVPQVGLEPTTHQSGVERDTN